MAMKIVQIAFILSCVVMGVFWANHLSASVFIDLPIDIKLFRVFCGFIGGGVGLLVLLGLKFVTQELFDRLFPVFIAVTISMVLGYGLALWVRINFGVQDLTFGLFLTCSFVLVFAFIGISLGLTKASNFEKLMSAVNRGGSTMPNPKLVDTSVIIDGRVADIVKTHFIEGTLIVPRFVLKELQLIADSADMLKRAKGRRGLDILKAMQEESPALKIQIVEDDPQHVREVDGKLVALAQQFGAKVLTNDYNLSKVAQIEGVDVLNINDLANALKPAVLPDEEIEVKIIKEGKEASQGVGYLDDGTMIVVEGGRNHVGRNVNVTVTSVLQTAAGRMVFTKFIGIVT